MTQPAQVLPASRRENYRTGFVVRLAGAQLDLDLLRRLAKRYGQEAIKALETLIAGTVQP
jgi:hypothetical protein